MCSQVSDAKGTLMCSRPVSSKAGFDLAQGLRQTANSLPSHVKPQATPKSHSQGSSWALTPAEEEEPKLLVLASVS